ncbi:S8 family peptidase [Actinokineospora auranticolor]|uniref:Subtilisin family serine protease n=1 Tax=Actinokineospora auranticolor TaxID=155976 RepID=A0A2S6GTT8_9PSEU|nr:S8 family peptidase [Actinokineospora auranticolor]PPK68541.1 subtilisin family serine protease [Actinokineospora auranticolor]
MSTHFRARTAVAAVAAAAAVLAVATPAQAEEGQVRAASGTAVTGSYVVVFKDGAVHAAAGDHAGRYGGTVEHTYSSALNGYSARLSERAARRIAADPSVAYVTQDHVITAEGTQSSAPWGLDRIDQRNLPLSKTYTYPDNGGSGVTAYIVDTGVRISHKEFEGRARNGYDAVDKDNVAQDGHGHGTHVAGIVGGRTYGVAKKVGIVAVRVLGDNGSGTLAGVIAGIDWVTKDAAGKKAVANLSLGGGKDDTVDTAVRNSIRSGVTYAVAAGNSNADAAGFSPARVPEAITVAASDNTDRRASFSNYGDLVDLFGPGVSIVSAWRTSDTATQTVSGTSQATPHVAGAAALYLTGRTATPAQVRDALVASATKNKVTDPKSPNNLVYTGA